jgi:hypothetical protein
MSCAKLREWSTDRLKLGGHRPFLVPRTVDNVSSVRVGVQKPLANLPTQMIFGVVQ